MKSTGVVRKIDELGRFVIPKEIATNLRMRKKDTPISIYTEKRYIVLERAEDKKEAAMVRGVDELGRICIPIEVRRRFKIKNHDPLEVFSEDNKIYLKPYQRGCIFCGEANMDLIIDFKENTVCKKCIREMAQLEVYSE